MAALTAREMINKKPRAATRPRLIARARMRRVTESPFGSAFQITFSADCISPNTPGGGVKRVTTPITAAHSGLLIAGVGGGGLNELGALFAHDPAQLLDERVLGSLAA